MAFFADLHLHSRYSRATSKDLTLEGVYRWARLKGIQVVGTGDFTHPGWLEELETQLLPLGNGLFRLREPPRDPAIPGAKPQGLEVFFLLSAEISTIYRQGDRVRKNHHLVFAPDFEKVKRFNARLSRLGNLAADGRPILGLPCRDLLEIVLTTSTEMVLVPAHIWTPWFSLFGSRSGFDRIEDCFGDLKDSIFALETGLSSDPPMNWRVSALDGYTLISNSDAHSPRNLGREANLFHCELSYSAIFNALKTRQGFAGTVEFFPEEGKYHYDGHRECNVVLHPDETRKNNFRCPSCGEELTIGVLHRVLDIADTPEGRIHPSPQPFSYLIPLPEVIGELLETTPNSMRALRFYSEMISQFGNEYNILFSAPLEEVERKLGSLWSEAIRRIRCREVHRQPGYDGKYGIVKVFSPDERFRYLGQKSIALQGALATKREPLPGFSGSLSLTEEPSNGSGYKSPFDSLSQEQERIVADTSPGLLLLAGPGTGKTRVLVAWICHRLLRQIFLPEEVLVLTFSRKAAEEIRRRIALTISASGLKGSNISLPLVTTFHAFALKLLRELDPTQGELLTPDLREEAIRLVLPELPRDPRKFPRFLKELERGLEGALPREPEMEEHLRRYRESLRTLKVYDLGGVVLDLWDQISRRNEKILSYLRGVRAVAVDELQDISPVQYKLLKFLAQGRVFFGVGDPHQAIYGFRGSSPHFFFDLRSELSLKTYSLTQSFRLPQPVGQAAEAILPRHPPLNCLGSTDFPVVVWECANPEEEAEVVTGEILTLLGGLENLSRSLRKEQRTTKVYAPEDIAILFRLRRCAASFVNRLKSAGIPLKWGEGVSLWEYPPFSYLWNLLHLIRSPGSPFLLLKLLRNLDPQREVPPSSSNLGALLTLSPRFRAFWEEWEPWRASLGSRAVEVWKLIEELSSRFLSCFPSVPSSPLLDLQWECLREEAKGFGADLRGFLETSALDPFFAQDLRGKGVSLLTFHAAKGLEFPVVFLVGLEEGITPLKRPETNEEDEEEERRLFYVALTRAKERLILTYSRALYDNGHLRLEEPSRFIRMIPPGILLERKPRRYLQLSLTFGEG